jgi:uncharacterized protein YlbG (UPF0298 family)
LVVLLNRLCYIVYFRHRGALRKIKRIKVVDVYYISNKNKYLTLYVDNDQEKAFIAELKKIKGVRSFEQSLLDTPEINIDLN